MTVVQAILTATILGNDHAVPCGVLRMTATVLKGVEVIHMPETDLHHTANVIVISTVIEDLMIVLGLNMDQGTTDPAHHEMILMEEVLVHQGWNMEEEELARPEWVLGGVSALLGQIMVGVSAPQEWIPAGASFLWTALEALEVHLDMEDNLQTREVGAHLGVATAPEWATS